MRLNSPLRAPAKALNGVARHQDRDAWTCKAGQGAASSSAAGPVGPVQMADPIAKQAALEAHLRLINLPELLRSSRAPGGSADSRYFQLNKKGQEQSLVDPGKLQTIVSPHRTTTSWHFPALLKVLHPCVTS